jgi:DNA repair protein RadD
VLRDYQVSAVEQLRAAFGVLEADRRRVLLVSPVGSGKTRLGAEIARLKVKNWGKKVLWIAHRTELIDQAASALTACGLSVGAIAAGSSLPPQPFAPVQVASIQTLAARGRVPEADMVIWDEAHHASAKTYADLFAQYAAAQHVGLTATPERADGKP